MLRLPRKLHFFWTASGLILLLIACSTRDQTDVSTDALALVTEEQTLAVADSQAELNMSSLTDLAVPAQESADECLICHTDKQSLIDAAAPEVVVESESEGEG